MPGELFDPYAVLGVLPTATAEEITCAYRRQVRAHHPDTRTTPQTLPPADEQLRRVLAAYEILRDAQRRARYDRAAERYIRTIRRSPPVPQAAAATTNTPSSAGAVRIFGGWRVIGRRQTMDIARTALLAAGWRESVPGVTVDRQCGSSQQSIHFAAAGVVAGHYDVVVAGGVESMSRVPMGASLAGGGNPFPQGFMDRYGVHPNQGIGAEMIAEQWGFDRTKLDEFSLGSHEKAAAAQDSGAFDDQIVAIKDQDGNPVLKDEGIRRGTPMEKMAQLKPAFKEDGVIHAGNSSQISDGSAAVLIMTDEKAKSLGLKPIAKINTAVLAGANPVIMLTAPIPATQKALKKSGLSISDIGVFEVNEAFAPVPLAWLHDIGADEKNLNPNGGAIALGHPLGGSGARIMTTMVHHMRDKGIRYGLQTMCEGGGQANATIVELL